MLGYAGVGDDGSAVVIWAGGFLGEGLFGSDGTTGGAFRERRMPRAEFLLSPFLAWDALDRM